jgi:hypothetical protein
MIQVVVIVLLVHKIKGGIGAEIGRVVVNTIVDTVVVAVAGGRKNAVEGSTGTASYEKLKKGKRTFTAI